ncbi:MAG: sigma-70 family RNA polymerase sigma factor [Planctomycetes bacterium]|nr:sigma-70 family RNA polymerase sigma factor [Planctomycetota bacterium]
MRSSFAETIARARQGDADSAEQLLAPHLARLTAFVRLNCGVAIRRRESCSDLVQSICREALESLSDLDSETEDGFRRWLYALALNLIMNKGAFHTRARRDVQRDAMVHSRAVENDDLLRSYADLCTPSHRAMAREDVARIEAAFDRLPSDYRDVLVLRFFADLPHAEIAARMNRSEAATRKLLLRARARLAILFEE